MPHKDLITSIVSKRCVLFAGAGLTCDTGGTLWKDLIEDLKVRFSYKGPFEDYFEILDDIMTVNNPKTVYDYISGQLCNAYIDQSLIDFIKLPWFSVLTTNYDTALENALNEYYALKKVCTVDDNYLIQLDWHSSELYCVKLMGSCNKAYLEKGSMVLIPGEFEKATEERKRIFLTLEAYAANFSFLFVGYSFKDKLFLNTLQKIEAIIGKSKNKHYAIFLNEIEDEITNRRLIKYNIEPIIGDIRTIAKDIVEEVKIFDVNDLLSRKILYGSQIASLNPIHIGHFLSQYEPVFFENLEEDVTIKTFLRGELHSFKPFDNGWHFNRKEIDYIIKEIVNNDVPNKSKFVGILGYPGSGKSFTIHAVVNKLIRNHNSVAIKIRNSINKIPTSDDLEEFTRELERVIEKKKLQPVERIILFSTIDLELADFLQYYNLSKLSKYPIYLLFESLQFNEKEYLPSNNIWVSTVNLNKSLDGNETERLVNYLVDINKKHNFQDLPEIDLKTSEELVKSEKNFLSLMYRYLDPARRSIERIISETFVEIIKKDPKTKDLICFVCLSSYFKLPIPLSILKKCFVTKYHRFNLIDLEILIDEASQFVILNKNSLPVLSIYHPYITQYLVETITISQMDEYLKILANSVTLTSKTDADFVNLLFIDYGIKKGEHRRKPFSDIALIHSLFALKQRQPARLVIHQLAKLCYQNHYEPESVRKLLEEAQVTPPRELQLYERIENVLTTKANIEWNYNKQTLLYKSYEDDEVQDIIRILNEAKRSHKPNVHPYSVHARILVEFWENAEDSQKFELMSKILDVINEGLEICDEPEGEVELNKILFDFYSELDIELTERNAQKLMDERNNGVGYYVLAKYYYNKGDVSRAEKFLDICIGAELKPQTVFLLKFEMMIKKQSPNYQKLRDYADVILKNNELFVTWKTAYFVAVTYAINGIYDPAKRFFDEAHKKSKKIIDPFPDGYIFWMENSHRKIFTGDISNMTKHTGWISPHTVSGWSEGIFFEPESQKNYKNLKVGNKVNFELGYNLRGPIAFEVEPYNWKRKH